MDVNQEPQLEKGPGSSFKIDDGEKQMLLDSGEVILFQAPLPDTEVGQEVELFTADGDRYLAHIVKMDEAPPGKGGKRHITLALESEK